ncbi:MAG TPA: TatD family hydrolase [Verrucomicrobiales bacterium]|nr:TatD family hydrolase [Verrucomicrobiales bacterium]
MLTDTHCHLASRKFAGDLEEVLKRASLRGVSRLVAIGTDLQDGPAVVQLASCHPGTVFATVGIHPGSVTEIDLQSAWLDRIAELAEAPQVCAIGEIGLDFFHPPPEGWSREDHRAAQREVFRLQLELAANRGFNVVVHQRNSWDETHALVREFDGRLRAVFHCFTETAIEADAVFTAGHLVSFTGMTTFRSNAGLLALAGSRPAGSYMVETDAPYLAPEPYRGKRCEPAFVRETAEAIAAARNETLEQVAEETTRTAEDFFRFG